MTDTDPATQPPLAEADVRAIIALLGAVADLPGDALAKKTRLMDGLCELLDADAWMWVVSRFDPGGEPMAVLCHHGGFSERQLGLVFEATQDAALPPPDHAPMAERVALGRPVCLRRVDLVPDDGAWYGPHWQRYRKPMGLDEFLYGIVPIAGAPGRGHLISGVGLHRETGQAGFTERDRRLLHIVITEVPWLHRAGLPEAEAAGLKGIDREGSGLHEFGRSVSDLTPRLRTVFGLLMQGWKRPRIAEHLGISENTAKAHIRDIYRHFEVEDHVALLRRFMG